MSSMNFSKRKRNPRQNQVEQVEQVAIPDRGKTRTWLQAENNLNPAYTSGASVPARTAWQLLRELNIQALPIDPGEIAAQLGIPLWEREFGSGYDGCLMQVGTAWGILINSAIQSDARKNFTIAHELGHYHLEHDTAQSCSLAESPHQGVYRYHEQRANQFAAELLMPTPIFVADAAALSVVGLPAIVQLAVRYGTSLTSTGLHYTRLSDFNCAIVFSENRHIKYFAYSAQFREHSDCYLVKGQLLHPGSYAFRLSNAKASSGREAIDTLEGEVPLHAWCQVPPVGCQQELPMQERLKPEQPLSPASTRAHTQNYHLYEHSIRLSRTNQIVSFLQIPS